MCTIYQPTQLLRANTEANRLILKMHAFNLLDSRSTPPLPPAPQQQQQQQQETHSLGVNRSAEAILDTFRVAELGHGAKPVEELEGWYSSLRGRHIAPVLSDDRWNWTGRERAIDKMPNGTLDDTVRKYEAASMLYSDFLETANTWAKALVLEKYLPEDKRQLHPIHGE
jgi:hypothetical protein